MFTNMKDGTFSLSKIIPRLFFLAIIVVAISGSFGTVNAGERGVKTRLGAVVGTAEPGIYFKIPIIEKMTIMEVKTRTINYDQDGQMDDLSDTSRLSGASKDLQDVWIGVVVNYHVDAEKVSDIYSQYKSVENFESNVIEPIIREVVKSTAAQYTAEELVTKRADFGDKVNITLAERFTTKNAILERFSVTNFEFSAAFTEAIENKMPKLRKINSSR
jgi:regulator of protease activity HflC (stomatin/prohibitin superfamily)